MLDSGEGDGRRKEDLHLGKCIPLLLMEASIWRLHYPDKGEDFDLEDITLTAHFLTGCHTFWMITRLLAACVHRSSV